jgi:hypothetical protein
MIARSLCLGMSVILLVGGVAQAQSAPKVVTTVPEIGAKDVDPALTEIRVVFDQPMAGGFSWTGGGEAFPEIPGTPRWEADKKTCVLPVKLAEGKFYRIGINSSGARNFKSEARQPAEFDVIYFATKGADEATLAKLTEPKIVSMEPANGVMDVSASTTKMVVTFDRPMSEGFSWTKTDGTQPEGTGKPEWNADRTVCTLPVTLQGATVYSIGLNHPFANNFQSAAGVPLEPVVWTFTTHAWTEPRLR